MNGIKGKRIAGIVAALVIACATVLAVCSPYIKPKANEEICAGTPAQETSFVFEDAGAMTHGISILKKCEIPRKNFEDYGIAPQAESAKLLTAVFTPDSDLKYSVQWSIRWDPSFDSNGWQDGKTVADYVTLSVLDDYPNMVTVACTQAFGHRILVEVKTADNASEHMSASVPADYIKQLDEELTSIGYTSVSPVWGVGTVTPELIYGQYNAQRQQRKVIYPTEAFSNALNEYGLSASEYAIIPGAPTVGTELFVYAFIGYIDAPESYRKQALRDFVAACKISSTCVLEMEILLRYNGQDVKTITKQANVTLDYSAIEAGLDDVSIELEGDGDVWFE